MTSMPRVLIVDDEPNTVSAMAELIAREGFTPSTAGSLAEARARIAEQAPDVLLLDLHLPDGAGLELLKDLDPEHSTQVILITGNATVDSAIEALRTRVLDYLTKPVDIPRLKSVLANLSRTLAMQQEIGSLRSELRRLGHFGAMIGSSPVMQKLYDVVSRVAVTDATVFLTGESGSGKEVVASTIHQLSPRRGSPFVALNCGAIPPNLIESELFGHERGSFTGATQQHRGYFERATHGTLFLDEVTEMPLELQVKLLRVLETSTVNRIGGDVPIAVDIRLIAATNRSPEEAVRSGRFREDLLYRLNVFPIVVPPLRERLGDAALLAEHFLAQHNQAEGTTKSLSEEALRRLAAYPWPGNVRELKNVIHREFILAQDQLQMGSIQVPGDARPARREPAFGLPGAAPGAAPPGGRLADLERAHIMATLEACLGDKKQAAEILGISLKTLYNRLNAYSGGD